MQPKRSRDENGRKQQKKNPSIIFVSVFYSGKREQERNGWETGVEKGYAGCGNGRDRNRNTLLFNHHSLRMNVTLDTPLRKLFFKKYDHYFLFPTWSTCIDVEEHERIYGVPIFFSEFYKYETNTELSRLKTGSRKYGRDTPLSSSCPISIFFVNTKMGEINIKIWAGRNWIFSIRFHPYTCRCRCRQLARRAWRPSPGMARRQHQPSS